MSYRTSSPYSMNPDLRRSELARDLLQWPCHQSRAKLAPTRHRYIQRTKELQ